MQDYSLNLLGLNVAFRSGVDAERVHEAKDFVEERFQKLSHGSRSSKELLLTFLVLGLADDLLQSQKQFLDVENRIEELLAKIEKVV